MWEKRLLQHHSHTGLHKRCLLNAWLMFKMTNCLVQRPREYIYSSNHSFKKCCYFMHDVYRVSRLWSLILILVGSLKNSRLHYFKRLCHLEMIDDE